MMQQAGVQRHVAQATGIAPGLPPPPGVAEPLEPPDQKPLDAVEQMLPNLSVCIALHLLDGILHSRQGCADLPPTTAGRGAMYMSRCLLIASRA